MSEIDVRELKASLSSTLRRVEGGERIKVTVKGRHVADLIPASTDRSAEQLRALEAAGKMTPAARPRPDHSPKPVRSGHSASAIVLAERDEED